ncbi:helix-turn-helix domain-containing protein [Billgrantia ethanolica]|uniref:Helix-turn-helix transcriptional regulator n=1 Tax=Billgrantia ethanolica TaxID=2733486 RepID=A0ABS9A380_9GAMM|nr:AraC family transcriptional regulator [Halomonas ethanolica]MCE8003226.1 helix-turn-helix transcriptional regulator [Halomonas ethanolica]
MIPLTSRPDPPTALVDLRDQLIRLLDDAEAALPRNQQAARASLVLAMNLLTQPPSEAGPKPPVHGGLVSWQVKRVVAFVEQHLGSTIRVTDMACEARLSLSHFSHAFTHTFGESPLAYVTRHRLLKACEMMRSSAEPLSSIAHECGFYDQSHFTRHFHRRLGMTPQRWRRLHADD